MNGKKARHYFETGYLCAESVLLAGADILEINNPAIPAMATAFCSGTSRTRGTCGAYQGAVLLISILHGRSNSGQDLDFCYGLVQDLTEWFRNNYGTTDCLQITGCDFSLNSGRKKFKEEGIKVSTCYPLVDNTTEFVTKLLKENS
ncbi:C-GCAxxG-C-C family protein [Maridesulfovibrio sp.]|uniref:C-GCAxxG-C-C family protein n=1 Tax=Maridesulfovibrio sp. TaxID=2795000 RepID=UPI0029CA0F34|nr:C-GCAxxG-C-C family protein [Maridesulfovibrio sp.]